MEQRRARIAVMLGTWLVARGAAAATTINVSDVVLVPAVKRFGINLGHHDYYEAFLLKNLVFRNQGFEGLLYQAAIRCASGTATTCVDSNLFTGWPSGFWNGASYEFIWGTAKGRRGTIATSTAGVNGTTGTTFAFADSATSPGVGDYMVLRKTFSGGADVGWMPTIAAGGAVLTELSDLPPGTEGRQALRLAASGAGQSAQVSGFFDTLGGGVTFLQLSGSYRLSFKARGAGGSNALVVSLTRPGAGNTFVNQALTLSSAWGTYDFDFSASEDGSALGSLALRFSAAGSDVILDDVSLTRSGGDPTNTTAFRDAVVAALRTYNPGILRHWDLQQIGDSLDNQLAPQFGRLRVGYSAYFTDQPKAQFGLHEFLELAALLGAEPWYVVPITFSSEEMANLMEYLGGPASTPYGARRAARGRAAPWTEAFPRIHLEFGNESWNPNFAAGTIEFPVPYGNRGSELFGLARQSPYYAAGTYDFVLGGQAGYPARNRSIVSASGEHDSLAVAPYMASLVDTYGTNEELFGSLFAEPEWWSKANGFMRQNYDIARAAQPPASLAVYEVNLHTTQGAISQAALDAFTPSVGAGLAVTAHMLVMLKELFVRDQCLFSLAGYRFQREDGKSVALWGVTRDLGVSDRKRPQYLAAQLANEALLGNLLQTTHTGDDPTWDQPLVNRIQYDNAHFLQSYAFAFGAARALVVFNLSRTDALTVDFGGVNAPVGTVELRRLTSAAITDDNEAAQVVAIVSQTLGGFGPGQVLSLPPFSMTVLRWSLGGPVLSIDDQTVAEGAAANAAFRVTLSASSAQTVTVQYATSDDSARAPDDYAATSGILTFTPGRTTHSLFVPIVSDGVPEGPERFFVNLSQPSNATVARGQGSGTITDPPAAIHGPMYRAYNRAADYHFFTTDLPSKDFAVGTLGYQDESSPVPFYVWSTVQADAVPLFRMYNPNLGRHYYTADVAGRDSLIGVGMAYEKDEGFLYPIGTTPPAGTTELFRLYNNNSGTHLFTADPAQKDGILALFPGVWVQHTSVGFVFTGP